MILMNDFPRIDRVDINPHREAIHLRYQVRTDAGNIAMDLDQSFDWEYLAQDQREELLKINAQAQSLLDQAARVLMGMAL